MPQGSDSSPTATMESELTSMIVQLTQPARARNSPLWEMEEWLFQKVLKSKKNPKVPSVRRR